MSAASEYFEKALQRLKLLHETQSDVIDQAADLCADRIAKGGLIFCFGAGHSRMMCEEMTPRQGGFVGFYALVELAISNHSAIVGPNGLRGPLHLEKVSGYAEEILKSFRFGPNDGFIIISTSGIRPLIVEMAEGVKQRQMPLIAVVARAHSEATSASHQSGKKLIDIADIVIDNQCPPGDCIIELEGLEWRTGPLSTVTGGMLMNMLRVSVAEKLLQLGHPPVLLPSHQFIGNTSAEEQLEFFYDSYRKSLSHLFVNE
ncbi:MAG: SIS domain-containing protein [Bacteroidetes bacterium]|nr:SIS domain-containing protein [Bacteroidota bacterium]MCY4234267.1 SIS domain-containing protein [Bacteroidota bacterium]